MASNMYSEREVELMLAMMEDSASQGIKVRAATEQARRTLTLVFHHSMTGMPSPPERAIPLAKLRAAAGTG